MFFVNYAEKSGMKTGEIRQANEKGGEKMKRKSPFPVFSTPGQGDFRDERIPADPLGSYTGRPQDDVYEIPVQDADDL